MYPRERSRSFRRRSSSALNGISPVDSSRRASTNSTKASVEANPVFRIRSSIPWATSSGI